ncbi:MAG: glycosyltransferase family 2 protein [Bacteroides sp.]|nr:glycosyltransferase family 2 protein [Bacteroides sp.]
MKPIVSIITINFNGLHDTCAMIESLKQHETYPYEVIVVDNGSKQDEASIIAERYPTVKVVRNENTGFAGGNNVGLRLAEGEYIFFLNNDTEIKEPVLEKLVTPLKMNEKCGGVSPMIRYFHAPDTLQYAGFTELTNITLRNSCIGFGESHKLHTQAHPTASLHGAAMMVPMRVIEKVGTMTEVYFLFYEELDWSEQIKRGGYELWYEPSVSIYHKEGQTARKGSAMREFYLSRARVLFARRNRFGFKRLLCCLYLLSIATPKKALTYLLQGEGKLAWAAIKGSIKGLFMVIGPTV